MIEQMADNDEGTTEERVLQSKRAATTYQILVEIAKRQPAVSQQEIADAIGVTAQAVSDYLQTLIERGHVNKRGRGRYEVTKTGVDWLITQTDTLREFVDHVSEDVLDNVGVETVIAATDIEEGDTVSLTMRDGVLHAVAGSTGSATAVAVTDASVDQDVGVTNFEGVIEYDIGSVTVVSVPPVQEGGSVTIAPERIVELASSHDLVAVDSSEGVATARAADLTPDIRFGTEAAVKEAATKGQDVLLLVVNTRLSAYTDTFREHNVSYEVIDPVDDR